MNFWDYLRLYLIGTGVLFNVILAFTGYACYSLRVETANDMKEIESYRENQEVEH